VTIQLQRLKDGRWRAVRTLRQNGAAGKNRLRAQSRARAAKRRAKRAAPVRYRAEAVAVDVVGNRSPRARLRVSAAAAKRLQRR
jgi:hypothetical protein